LLPVPEARRVPPVDDDAIRPLLKTIVGPSSAQSQSEAIGAVERLGLGALPHIHKELTSLPKEHLARERLTNLAARVACIVNEIRFSSDSVARPDAMRRAAGSLKNQPLSSKALIELLGALHKLVPAESGGIGIALDRDGDGTGVQIEIRVFPRRDPAEGEAVHLRLREQVVVDGHEVLDSGSATVGIGQETPSEWSSTAWKGLASALQKALEAPSDKPYQVRAEVTRGR
jgi:hypothetical protein